MYSPLENYNILDMTNLEKSSSDEIVKITRNSIVFTNNARLYKMVFKYENIKNNEKL